MQMDLLVLGLAAGATNVGFLQMGDGADGMTFTVGGVKWTRFHLISHRPSGSLSRSGWPKRRSPCRALKTGQYVSASGTVTSGAQGAVADNKLLDVLINAAGIRKPGGAPVDDFGDPSLPNGLLPGLLDDV